VEYAKKSQEAAPTDPSARARLARPLRALGRAEEASALVEHLDAVRSAHGLFLALHGALQRDRGDDLAARMAFSSALHHDPLSPEVACELVAEALLPGDAARAALCRMARRR
jgi:Flp pilus assembly protein TadD